tara:strand:+ start:344 stop:886 length:543 start_codon:yes stop_codon:yes gene_type:complete
MEGVTKSRKKSGGSIYMKSIMTRKISIPFNKIGSNIESLMQRQIVNEIEGQCIIEGFVKPRSVNILKYTSGKVEGVNCIFEVMFEASICRPVEGMRFKCIVKNITKAGIRAETAEIISPVVIFIARDHYHTDKYFSTIKNDDIITIKVIGIRYELNDKYISVIADLVKPKKKEKKKVLLE